MKSKLKHIIQFCYIYYAYCTILSISKITPRDSGRIINEDICNLATSLPYPKMLNYFRNLGPDMLCPPLPSQFPLKRLPSRLPGFSPSFIWNSCWEYKLKLVTRQEYGLKWKRDHQMQLKAATVERTSGACRPAQTTFDDGCWKGSSHW